MNVVNFMFHLYMFHTNCVEKETIEDKDKHYKQRTASVAEMSTAVESRPLQLWFLKKSSEFHCLDCNERQILMLFYQIHLVLDCFTFITQKSHQIRAFF